MKTLTVEETAEILHLNTKRVQGMARLGTLPAFRVGRKWLFHSGDIEALLGCPVLPPARPTLSISARNRLAGRVARVTVDGLMAEVLLQIGDQELVSLITRSSVERLGLKVGDRAYAVIKSTEVMIGKEDENE